MPDVHWGIGATVGSVIPTRRGDHPGGGRRRHRLRHDGGADHARCAPICPTTCARCARAIERAVPHGRTDHGGRRDEGAWGKRPPARRGERGRALEPRLRAHRRGAPAICERGNHVEHLGTLGTGNHFIEVCLDEAERVWFMLHSGSRGVGNRIGTHFIELAKKDMQRSSRTCPTRTSRTSGGRRALRRLRRARSSGRRSYARANRELMMAAVVEALRGRRHAAARSRPTCEAVNCHHNYVAREHHFGARRVRDAQGRGARAAWASSASSPAAWARAPTSCAARATPTASRAAATAPAARCRAREAKRRSRSRTTRAATAGIECRKDEDVIDETPGAYKAIDAVMAAQTDLVEVVHTLRQVVCVKG